MDANRQLDDKRPLSIGMLVNESQQDVSDEEVPPDYQGAKRTGNSEAEMMPGHDSDCNQNSADSTNLDLTQQPETMNPLHITTYIKALPEYTQWMDVFSLLTTNDEDCHHHLEVLRKWRELRYPNCLSYDMLNARPKRPTGSSSATSETEMMAWAVLAYKKLVDSAISLDFPALRREARMKLLDYLVMCYIRLDNEEMTNRLPDHEHLFQAAVDDLRQNPGYNSTPGGGEVPPEVTEGAGKDVITNLVESLVMKPVDFVNVPHWDEIVGNDQAKASLRGSIMDKTGSERICTDPASFLLFGPPGTAKTTMVKSMARSAGLPCLEVRCAMIKKQPLSVGEDIVAKIFSHAKAIAPCVMLIDKVEEMLALDPNSKSDAGKGINVQLMICMSALKDSGDKVWIIGTTNKPWDLSLGIRRRFTERIYVPLPEKEDVLKLLKYRLRSLTLSQTRARREPFALEKAVLGQELDVLVTDYFRKPQKQHLSGDEVLQSMDTIPETLSQELLLSDARIFKKEAIGGIQYITPCKDFTEDGAFHKQIHKFGDRDRRMLRFRPIAIGDVRAALDRVECTSTGESIKAFDDWNRDFGTGPKYKTKQHGDEGH